MGARRSDIVAAITGIVVAAGGCGLLEPTRSSSASQPSRPERAVDELRRELQRHVSDPEALGKLSARVDAVQRRFRAQARRIAELESQVAGLQGRLRRTAKREPARIEIRGLTGFTDCAGKDAESGLEVHVRAVDGNDNETRVNGTFEFFLVRHTTRLLLTHRHVEQTWRRPAQSKRDGPSRGVFSHYVYCLPCPAKYRAEPGLHLQVRLTTESGKTFDAERELKPNPAPAK